MALLISSILLPTPLWAADDARPFYGLTPPDKAQNQIIKIFLDTFRAVENKENLRLSYAEANFALMLKHEVSLLDRDNNTTRTRNLLSPNTGLVPPDVDIEQITVEPISNGIRFRMEGEDHVHDVSTLDSRNLIDYTKSENAFYFLFDDGSLFVVPKIVLSNRLFRGNFPIVLCNRFDNVGPEYTIRVTQRIDPDLGNITLTDEFLEQGRPIAPSDTLVAKWRAKTKRQQFEFEMGNIALVRGEPGSDEVVDVVSRMEITIWMDATLNVIMQAARVVNKSRDPLTRWTESLSEEFSKALDTLTNDEDMRTRFILHDYADALARFPIPLLDRSSQHARQAIERYNAQKDPENQEALRDRFTLAEQTESYEAAVAALSTELESPPPIVEQAEKTKKRFFGLTEKLVNWSKSVNWGKKFTRLARSLAIAAGIGGAAIAADHYAGHIASNTIVRLWNTFQAQVSAVDPSYFGGLALAVGCNIGIGSLILIGAATYRWIKNKKEPLSKIVMTAGIRGLGKALCLFTPRGLLRFLGRHDTVNALIEGDLQLSFRSGLPREKVNARTDDRIMRKDRLWTIANAIAYGMLSVRERQSIGNHLTQKFYLALRSAEPELVKDLFEKDPDLFKAAWKNWEEKFKELKHRPAGVLQRTGTWFKAVAGIRFLRWIGRFGSGVPERLANAEPDIIVSSIAFLAGVMAVLTGIISTASWGAWGITATPDHRFYQPGAIAFTHPEAFTNLFVMVLSNISVYAASFYLYFLDRRNKPLLESYQPKLSHLLPDKEGYRSLEREIGAYLKNLFNFRKTQPAMFAIQTTFYKYVVCFHASFLLYVMTRMLTTDLGSAISGELSAWACYMFSAGFIWAFHLTAEEATQADVQKGWNRFRHIQADLDQVLRRGATEETVRRKLNQLLLLYEEDHIDVWSLSYQRFGGDRSSVLVRAQQMLDYSRQQPPLVHRFEHLEEVWNDLERALTEPHESSSKQLAAQAMQDMRRLYKQHGALPEGEPVNTVSEYAGRVIEFAAKKPPVPQKTRGDLSVATNLIAAISAAIMGSYMLAESWKTKGVWDVDWSRWHLWLTMPEGDGPVSLIAKAAAWFLILYVGTKAYNYVSDRVRALVYRVKQIFGWEQDEETARSLAEDLKESQAGLEQATGWNTLRSLTKKARSAAGKIRSTASSLYQSCSNLLGEVYQSFGRNPVPIPRDTDEDDLFSEAS